MKTLQRLAAGVLVMFGLLVSTWAYVAHERYEHARSVSTTEVEGHDPSLLEVVSETSYFTGLPFIGLGALLAGMSRVE